jgi:hypothetical protein
MSLIPKADTPQRVNCDPSMFRFGEQCIDLPDGLRQLLATAQMFEVCRPLVVTCGTQPMSDFEAKVIPHRILGTCPQSVATIGMSQD